MFKPVFLITLLFPAAPVLGHEPQSAPANATKPESAPVSLDWLTGDWIGEGITFGRPSRVTLSLRPIFGGRTMMMDYAVSVVAKDNIPALNFAAHAYYKVGKGKTWDGRWIDNFDNFHNLSGMIKDTSMATLWGSPSTEIGRTTYTRVGDTLSITDKSLTPAGNFDVFATYTLRKK